MKTVRNTLIVLFTVAVMVAVTFVSVGAANPGKKVFPEAITADSACPVAGCTSDEGCHAAGEYPEPKEGQVMICPSRTGCEAEECHAIERATATSRMPQSTSLYFWVIGLTLLTLLTVFIIRKA